MPFITIVAQFYQGQKTQGCGMLWGAATTKWGSQMKPKDAMLGHKTARIGKG